MAETMVKISILLADGADPDAVAKAAVALGFRLEATHPRLGVMSGEAAPASFQALRGLPGVQAVEEARAFRKA